MSRTVVIHFPPGQDDGLSLVSRLRNFGETVFRKLPGESGWGEINLEEVDRASERFSITQVKGSKLRRLQNWLETEVQRQRLRIALEIR